MAFSPLNSQPEYGICQFLQDLVLHIFLNMIRTILLFCIGALLSFVGHTQYTTVTDTGHEIAYMNGFDYIPSNPMIVDYMSAGFKDVDPLAYPTVVLDTTKTKWSKTDTGKSLIASGALIALGLYTYKDNGFLNRVSVKEGINRYLPDFENALDDYTQFIPYIAIYALDGLGVKSKHKFKRKTTTLATAIAGNLIVVQGMKYGIAETRPDGSTDNAFPSGHTATAFMGAHMLHKEYGDRSIYYSVGGYLFATITGIFRQLNDRHWISDVLVGAGIGISVTELAYFVNEKIYKDEGINEIEINQKPPNKLRPSFLGVKIAYADLTEGFNAPEIGVTANGGFSLAVEGAWFFSKFAGIGGEVGFQSFPIDIADSFEDVVSADGFDVLFQPVGSSKMLAGPYLQYTRKKSMLGVKFLIGSSRVADTEILLKPLVDNEPSEIDDILFAEISPDTDFAWTTGIYYRWLIDQRLALGVYLDYSATNLDTTLRYIEDLDADPFNYVEEPLKDSFNSISAGISFNVMIW